MFIADDLVVRVVWVFAMPLEIAESKLKIVRMDEVLPLGCQMFLPGGVIAKNGPEAGAHPFILCLFKIPIPYAVEGSVLKKLKNG